MLLIYNKGLGPKDLFWSDLFFTDAAIRTFTETLPSLHDPRGTHILTGLGTPSGLGGLNPFLVSVHIFGHVACIYLHNNLARDGHALSYQRCLYAARRVMSVVHQITELAIENHLFSFVQVSRFVIILLGIFQWG